MKKEGGIEDERLLQRSTQARMARKQRKEVES
jgi:hypothetical protein